MSTHSNCVHSESNSVGDTAHLRRRRRKQQQQASAEVKTQAATSGRLPTWVPPQGRNTNIHPFVRPAKGVKKIEAPHINKDSSPLSVLMFFTEIFHLLVEQTNVYYQQHVRQTSQA